MSPTRTVPGLSRVSRFTKTSVGGHWRVSRVGNAYDWGTLESVVVHLDKHQGTLESLAGRQRERLGDSRACRRLQHEVPEHGERSIVVVVEVERDPQGVSMRTNPRPTCAQRCVRLARPSVLPLQNNRSHWFTVYLTV